MRRCIRRIPSKTYLEVSLPSPFFRPCLQKYISAKSSLENAAMRVAPDYGMEKIFYQNQLTFQKRYHWSENFRYLDKWLEWKTAKDLHYSESTVDFEQLFSPDSSLLNTSLTLFPWILPFHKRFHSISLSLVAWNKILFLPPITCIFCIPCRDVLPILVKRGFFNTYSALRNNIEALRTIHRKIKVERSTSSLLCSRVFALRFFIVVTVSSE